MVVISLSRTLGNNLLRLSEEIHVNKAKKKYFAK